MRVLNNKNSVEQFVITNDYLSFNPNFQLYIHKIERLNITI